MPTAGPPVQEATLGEPKVRVRRLLSLLGKNNECQQDSASATLLGEDHAVALVQAVRSQLEQWAAQVPCGGSSPVVAHILHRRGDLDPIEQRSPSNEIRDRACATRGPVITPPLPDVHRL